MKAARRLGCRPRGRTPASSASWSHQAPAALTSTGAWKLPWLVLTCHCSPSRLMPVTSQLCCTCSAVAANAAQVTLMQGVGVDVGGAGIEHGALDLVAAQYRHQRAGLIGAEHPHVGHVLAGAVELALQLFGVAGEVHHHLAARGE